MPKAAILSYPGTNCVADTAKALGMFPEISFEVVEWNSGLSLLPYDLVVLPGGFSYGDYLRSGAIAARDRVTAKVLEANERGRLIVGICNGFQILTECGILPGTLIRNRGLKFIGEWVGLNTSAGDGPFTRNLPANFAPRWPLANNDGEFHCDPSCLRQLEENGQIPFRYSESAARDLKGGVAGVVNSKGNALGLMPHPERALKYWHGSSDGYVFFRGIIQSLIRN